MIERKEIQRERYVRERIITERERERVEERAKGLRRTLLSGPYCTFGSKWLTSVILNPGSALIKQTYDQKRTSPLFFRDM